MVKNIVCGSQKNTNCVTQNNQEPAPFQDPGIAARATQSSPVQATGSTDLAIHSNSAHAPLQALGIVAEATWSNPADPTLAHRRVMTLYSEQPWAHSTPAWDSTAGVMQSNLTCTRLWAI